MDASSEREDTWVPTQRHWTGSYQWQLPVDAPAHLPWDVNSACRPRGGAGPHRSSRADPRRRHSIPGYPDVTVQGRNHSSRQDCWGGDHGGQDPSSPHYGRCAAGYLCRMQLAVSSVVAPSRGHVVAVCLLGEGGADVPRSRVQTWVRLPSSKCLSSEGRRRRGRFAWGSRSAAGGSVIYWGPLSRACVRVTIREGNDHGGQEPSSLIDRMCISEVTVCAVAGRMGHLGTSTRYTR